MRAATRSITPRVLAGFVLLFAVQSALLGVAIWGLWSTQRRQEAFLRDELRRMEHVPALLADLFAERLDVGLMLLSEPAGRPRIARDLAEREAEADALLSELAALARNEPGQAKHVRALRELVEDVRETRHTDLLPLLRAERVDEARAVYLGVQEDRYGSLRVVAMQLADQEWQDVERAAESLATRTRYLVLALFALGLLAVPTALMLLRAIGGTLRAYIAARDASQAELHALIESTRDLIWSVDAQDFRFVMFNRAARDYFERGLSRPLTIGMAPEEAVGDPELVALWRGLYQRALGEVFVTDYKSRTSERLLHLSMHPLMHEGRAFGVSVFARDLTEQKQTEQALREAREHLEEQVAVRTAELHHAYQQLKEERDRLSTLISSMSDEVWFADTNGRFVLANPAALRVFAVRIPADGIEVSELLGQISQRMDIQRGDGSVRPTTESPALRAIAGEIIQNEEEILRERETQVVRYRQVSASPVRDPHGRILGSVSVARDVTPERIAREALSVAQKRLALLLESSPIAMIEFSWDFRITRWSDEAARVFGWAADEARGSRLEDLTWVHPDDWPLVERAMREMRDGSVRSVVKTRNLRKDGSTIYCEWYNSAISDREGRCTSFLSLVLDVTQRTLAEQERVRLLGELAASNARLEELDRLKSMFIASMSHELRTPLNSILGFTGVILQGLTGSINDEQRKQLSLVKASGEHLYALICDVIDLSKIEAGIVTRSDTLFDLTELAREVCETLANSAPRRGVSVSLRAEGPCRLVNDAHRTKQILVNLLTNALKFTDRGGITIEVQARGAGAEVAVRDTGIGIAREDLPKLFQPFMRINVTGRTRDGSGIGLHLSRKLAELLGGTIEVESELHVGSVFRLWLPDRQPEQARAS